MEKRILLAALISVLFLSWYSQAVLRWSGGAGRQAPRAGQPEGLSVPRLQSSPVTTAETLHLPDKEEVVAIQSPTILIEIGKRSAAVRNATLKTFADPSGTALTISNGLPLIHLQLGQASLEWTVSELTGLSASFTAQSGQNNYDILYSLDTNNPLLNIEIAKNNSMVDEDVSMTMSWIRADDMGNRNNPLEAIVLEKYSSGKFRHHKYAPQSNREKHVPRGTSMLSLSERYFCLSVKSKDATFSTTILPSPTDTIAAQAAFSKPASTNMASVYIGPRDFFYLKRAGLSDAIPVGALGQIGLILLMVLKWIAGVTRSYGVGIILLSVLVTCATAPFTLLSFKSMKKMQELKPQVDKIMAQHKQDQARANRELFALYKTHRISPLSGCLPMLLQMPIFIALFQAISHFIELRGQAFLWANDLSLPDRLFKLPIAIPIVGEYFNLLPILMAGVMYVQTKASQKASGTPNANPAMAMMSGPIMPVMFGFMFYHFPSSLVIYWLTNSVISLVWYRLVK